MLMSDNATMISDSGGRVRATMKIIKGNDRIARLLIGLRRKRIRRNIEKPMLINGDLGIVSYVNERRSQSFGLRSENGTSRGFIG